MEDSGYQSSSNSLSSAEEKALLEDIYLHSLTSFKIQKSIYSRKIRLRRILTHTTSKDLIEDALKYFNDVLKAKLRRENIKEAEHIKPWFKDGQDILVTFRSISVRNQVYDARTLTNGGLFSVCDELSRERVAIWKILMNRYGETNVITRDGAVCLRRGGEEHKFITISSLKEFITKMNDVNTETCVA